MKTNVKVGNPNPTATLAINKGRVKMYNNKSNIPTYYLQKILLILNPIRVEYFYLI